MTEGQALQDWLTDRAAQHSTKLAMDDFSRQWRKGIIYRRFAEAMAALREPTAETIAEAAADLFGDHGWVDATISALAARLGADPFFVPTLGSLNSDIHSGLLIYEDDRLSITIGVSSVAKLAAKKNRRRGPTSIGFTGQVTVLKFVKAGGALLSLWEAPRIDASFTAATAGRCIRTGERRLADGDILIVDGRSQSYVIEHARSNLFVLQAIVAVDQAPVAVEYDSAVHTFVACSAKDDSASRIQMMTTLLRKLGCKDAFLLVAELLDHPDFFVRWHVMRELLGIDAAAALPHLRRMAEADPHPEARRVARKVLDRLEVTNPARAA